MATAISDKHNDLTRSRLRRELRPEDVTAIIDSRERRPFDLDPLRAVRGTLSTGDYSVAGLEAVISIERKSLADLVQCCGVERERFERELMRLHAYPVRAVLVEASWADLKAGGWRSKITPQSVTSSVLGWCAQGVPILLCGDRDEAAACCSKMLFIAARRRWRETLAFGQQVLDARAHGRGESGTQEISRSRLVA